MKQIVHVGTSKVRLKCRVKINWPMLRSGVTTPHTNRLQERVMKGLKRVRMWSL